MFTVHIRPHWEISVKGEAPLDTADLLGLLLAIQDAGSIAQAARTVGLSYRYAWGLLRAAEGLFGEQLMETGREQGLMTARGNPLGLRGLADLARPEVRFVNRQAGSGTRMLLEMMLAADGPAPESVNGFNSAELTHSAVAAYIASDMADAGFGMRAAAAQFRLDFLPLVREHYYFALRRDALEEPRMRQLIELMRQPAYHGLVAALPGYDAEHTGELTEIADAFALGPGREVLPA